MCFYHVDFQISNVKESGLNQAKVINFFTQKVKSQPKIADDTMIGKDADAENNKQAKRIRRRSKLEAQLNAKDQTIAKLMCT
jgi:hypothetical protein